MENIKQENRELREEVSTLKIGMAHLTTMMENLVAAQNQARTPPVQNQTVSQPQVTVTSEVVSTPIPVNPFTTVDAGYQMQDGFPYGMSENFIPGGYQPVVQDPQTVMVTAPSIVHTNPFAEEQIYYGTAPSESMGIYDRMNDCQDQFEAMQK